MILELKSTTKAVKIDIELDDRTTPVAIKAAVRCALNELRAVGLFPYLLVSPESWHYAVVKALSMPTMDGGHIVNNEVHSLVGNVSFPAFRMSTLCMTTVGIRSDRRLKNSIYLLAKPFDPFVIDGMEWPEEMPENDQNDNPTQSRRFGNRPMDKGDQESEES